jgi:hypothetical protein
MPEIGTSGLMSGDGKRGVGHGPKATAPILDSTISEAPEANLRVRLPRVQRLRKSSRWIPRAIVSEIGVDVIAGVRTCSRIDPLGIKADSATKDDDANNQATPDAGTEG